MRNRNRSHLGNLAEQLNDATEQLVKVVHRLDEFEAQVADKEYMSTIDPDDFEKCPDDAEEKPQHKLFNPEAGP
jgi:hypothetical protein